MRAVAGALAGVAALGAGTLTWSLLEAKAYTLRRFQVPILPAGAAPIRLLHLSDLHLVPTRHRLIDWVRALAETGPDVVVTTGDNFGHADALPALLEAYAPFFDLPGVFVTGSNDYYLPVMKNPLRYLWRRGAGHTPSKAPNLPTAEFTRALIDRGWYNLDNARAEISVRGSVLDFVGTGDAHIMRDSYPPPSSAAPDGTLIGLTHAPYARVLETMQAEGVQLALAGHTHGGQVCLPGFGALVTNCDLDRRMAKGLHRWPSAAAYEEVDPMWLHVSAGLGTSPYTPVRLACRPEASLITLTSL